jgi:hypothetical protein
LSSSATTPFRYFSSVPPCPRNRGCCGAHVGRTP